jgi:hypothetical protein
MNAEQAGRMRVAADKHAAGAKAAARRAVGPAR